MISQDIYQGLKHCILNVSVSPPVTSNVTHQAHQLVFMVYVSIAKMLCPYVIVFYVLMLLFTQRPQTNNLCGFTSHLMMNYYPKMCLRAALQNEITWINYPLNIIFSLIKLSHSKLYYE